MGGGQQAQLPAAEGFYDGARVLFVHPEASSREVADVLTKMMGSPVLVVPELADVPATALADVHAFRNGVEGNGPFGFQADVFDSAPGDNGYSPLRALNLVEWSSQAAPRVLRSAAEIRQAERNGELTIERTDTVVNMPMVRWPEGTR